MKITSYQILAKKITNNLKKDKYISDVLLYEANNLKKLKVGNNSIKVFRSARHKNDMPTIFTFGKFNDAMKDALTKISESGSSLIKDKSNLIISDHLTILGNNSNAFVITFLGGTKHLIRTEIRVDNKGNFISLKVYAEINKLLKPNETFITEKVELYHTDNVNEAIKDFAKKKIKGIKVHTKKCPAVYCTWYYYGSTITLNDCLTNLKEIKNKKLPLDTFQIDDGWEDLVGDWNPNKKFKDMKKVSKMIENYHLIPGLWTSPFIVDKNSKFVKSHPSWILKDTNNKPCIFEMNKDRFYIIDITIKDTWTYFEKLYRRLTKGYGFKYHKLDFTRAPIIASNANYKNKYITIVEAYRNACLSIRKGMGDSFFLMCGGLYDPLIGIVDAQRSGSDVLSMWSAMNRGGKTLPYTMKQSILRYYMNEWWYNDPDAFIIRRNKWKYQGLKLSLGLLNDEEVKTSTINQLLGGGLFSMTEPLNEIDEDRLNNIYHVLPLKKVNIEIKDIMSSPRFPNEIRVNNQYLALINYDDKKKLNRTITNKDINNKSNKPCWLVDFYNNKTAENKINVALLPHSATIIKLTNKKIKTINNKGHYLC
ncbi:MAG: alpha-galactosidase [Bacilli bacterium]|nr:alpha-galactosidase [Bacilli bacterium]